MPTTDTWRAYRRGVAAREQHKPFSSNPYKAPKTHTNWALGWMDSPAISKTAKKLHKARYGVKK